MRCYPVALPCRVYKRLSLCFRLGGRCVLHRIGNRACGILTVSQHKGKRHLMLVLFLL